MSFERESRYPIPGGAASGDVNRVLIKDSCRFTSTAAIPTYVGSGTGTLTAAVNGAFPVTDGVTAVVGDRFLLRHGASGIDNGIYRFVAIGALGAKWQLIRTSDANTSAEVKSGMFVHVDIGTANIDTWWTLTTPNPIVLETTALTFTAAAATMDHGLLLGLGDSADQDRKSVV